MSVVISHARDVLQGLAGTCLRSGTPVTIGGVFSRQLQGPEESLSGTSTCTDQIKKHSCLHPNIYIIIKAVNDEETICINVRGRIHGSMCY